MEAITTVKKITYRYLFNKVVFGESMIKIEPVSIIVIQTQRVTVFRIHFQQTDYTFDKTWPTFTDLLSLCECNVRKYNL